MSVEHVEVLVEEPSMEAALVQLLPNMLGDVSFAIHAHRCKTELLARLPDRLRGYESWLPPDYRIVVVVDRDDDDCVALKQELETIAAGAGLMTRGRCGRCARPSCRGRLRGSSTGSIAVDS